MTQSPTASAGATAIAKILRRDADAWAYLSDPAIAIEAAAFAIPVLGSIAATLVGSALVFHRQRAMWLRRQFESTVNISLNTVHSAGHQRPVFRMRTLREAQLRDLIPSDEGCASVLRAARQTSSVSPFVHLPPSCAVLVKNFVLNNVSEIAAVGHLAADMDEASVTRGCYVFGMTSEEGFAGGRKLRVILVRDETLRAVGAIDKSSVAFEGPYDHLRLGHVQRLAHEWMEAGAERRGNAGLAVPENFSFGTVELPVASKTFCTSGDRASSTRSSSSVPSGDTSAVKFDPTYESAVIRRHKGVKGLDGDLD